MGNPNYHLPASKRIGRPQNARQLVPTGDEPCVGRIDIFFHPRKYQQYKAAELCLECPLQRECLLYSLEAEEPYGVWGGLIEKDRHELLELMRYAKEKASV